MEYSKDFFISFNSNDRAWGEWIAWILEEKGYTTTIQSWDFRPGNNFALEMKAGMASARRVLAVLSPNYLSSKFAQAEWAAAFAMDPTGEKRLLIPVRVDDVVLSPLDASIVYIDLVGKDEAECQVALVDGVEEVTRLKPSHKPKFPALLRPEFPGPAVSPPVKPNSKWSLAFLNPFRQYATFRGRATRSEFWLFVLFNFVVNNVLGIVSGLVAVKTGHLEVALAGPIIYYLATLLPTLAVLVRRLHDTNRSGWWIFVALMPVVCSVPLITLLPAGTNPQLVGMFAGGLGAIALTALLVLKSQKGENLYGPEAIVVRSAVTARAVTRRKRWMSIAATAGLVGVLVVSVSLWLTFQGRKQQSGLVPLDPIVQVPPSLLFRGSARSANAAFTTATATDIEAAERALARNPNDPELLNDLGCLLDASGDTARGHALLSEAYRLRPDDPDIGYNYARSLFQQNKFNEAAKEVDALIARNPDSAQARLLKAGVDIRNKDYADAQNQVEKVLKSPEMASKDASGRPDKVTQVLQSLQIVAHVIQGVIDLAKRRTQQALDSFQAALKLGNDPAAAYNAGVAYQQLGQPSQAAPYYRQAIEAQPSLAEAHYNLGALMLAENDLQNARSELAQAATLKPDLLPSIQTALTVATQPDRQTSGLIVLSEFMRTIQNAIARLSGTRTMPVQEAVKSGAIETIGHFTGEDIRMSLKKTSQAGSGLLELNLAPGTILESESNLYSGFVVTRVIGRETVGQLYVQSTVSLSDSETVTFVLDGYRATPAQPPPGNVALTVAQVGVDPTLSCIAREPLGAPGQIATWIQTQQIKPEVMRQRVQLSAEDWAAVESLISKCKIEVR